MRRFQILVPIVLGLAAVVFVNVAVEFKFPGFDPRTGIPGTGFLRSLLYALGTKSRAMPVVSVVYFGYGCLLGILFVWAFPLRRSK